MRRLARAARQRLRQVTAPSLSVVVVDDGRPLEGCLASVTASTYKPVDVRTVEPRALDEALAAAAGRYLVVLEADDRVPAEAWEALVSSLESSGSDLAVGRRRPGPAPEALFDEARVATTAEHCPLALVDLAATGLVVRAEAWRRSGTRLGDLRRSAPAVLAAYVGAGSFDVLPDLVLERLDPEHALPVAEQRRFQAASVAELLDSWLAAVAVAPAGWQELVATHLLPPLYLDAVAGGPDYLAACRARLPALLDGVDPARLPLPARLGAWSAQHGSLTDLALTLDHLADHPDGLPVVAGRALPAPGLATPPLGAWTAVEEVDRALRSWVAPWAASTDGRLVLRGALFTTYVERAPLPTVSVSVADGPASVAEVVRRHDPRTDEWAARAFEERADAAWEATLDSTLLPSAPLDLEVEVRVGDAVRRHRSRLAAVIPDGATALDRLDLEDGVLRVGGRSGLDRLTVSVAGTRGSSPAVTVGVGPDGRFEADVALRTDAFGSTVRLPVGRYRLEVRDGNGGSVTARWAPGLLADPPELVDGRQRVLPVPGPAVEVRAPLRVEERGAVGQQRLHSRAQGRSGPPAYDAMVLLETFRGRSVGDNPAAVARELAASGLGLDLVWVVDDPAVEVPAGMRAVVRRRAQWYDAMANARVLVTNAGAPYWFEKRPGQLHLQTWHGTPLKRIGEDRGPGDFATWRHRRRIARQAAGWDALLSPSAYCSEIFRSAFRYDGPVLETGYPRNDLLVTDTGEARRRTRDRLGLDPADRVVLYAPTWRDHLGRRDAKPLYLDAERLVERLPDAVVLVRGHYNSTGQDDVFAGHPRIRDVTRYPDVADLYLAADALVTDYSSVMFDFALVDRPVVLLVPDLEQYRDVERGFYLDLEASAPGPLVTSTDEVVEVLRAEDTYAERRAACRDRFCPRDDGRASARVVSWLSARL